jgi:hypothetical protein
VPIGRSRVGGRLCYLTSRLFFRCMLWTRCSIRRSSEIFFFIFQAICTSQTQSKVDVVFVIQVSGEEGNRFGPCGPLVIRKFSFYERGSHRGEKEDYLLDCCLVSDVFGAYTPLLNIPYPASISGENPHQQNTKNGMAMLLFHILVRN